MPRQKTKLRAAAPLRGDVMVRVRSVETGAVLRRVQIRNKILDGGFAALVALLDVAGSQNAIARLRVGTGVTPPATSDADVALPITAATGTTYPYGKVDFTAVKTQSAPGGGPYALIVHATMPGGSDADPYNGKSISEAALILSNGVAFARQTHPVISKTPAIAIDYEWHISFIPAV